MNGKPWTEAHRREALVRSSELLTLSLLRDFHRMIAGRAAAALGKGPLLARGEDDIATEEGWRGWLLAANPGFGIDRIDREVRRVRALAEGRLVRETVWSIRYDADHWDAQGSDEIVTTMTDADRAGIRDGGGRVVRVTRVRKA